MNKAVESKLDPEQRHQLASLRAQLETTNARIGELNLEFERDTNDRAAAVREARRLSYLIQGITKEHAA